MLKIDWVWNQYKYKRIVKTISKKLFYTIFVGERLNSFNTSLLYSIDSNPKIITYTYIITRFFSNMCFNFFFTIMSYTSWRRVSATVQFEERALAVAFNRSLKMVLGFKYAPSDLLPLLLQSCISVSPFTPYLHSIRLTRVTAETWRNCLFSGTTSPLRVRDTLFWTTKYTRSYT